VLRERGEMRLLVEQHAQDASEMESLIDEIDAAEAEDWRPLYDQLVDAVHRHVELEETNIFPKAQQAIGDHVAKALEAKFLAAKNSAADILASFAPGVNKTFQRK
jgi:hemerythrin-like domain-containing protein